MEYNLLLLQGENLLYKNKSKLFALSKENFDILVKDNTLISNTISEEGSFVSEIVDLLQNNEVVVNLEKVSNALKEIENNQIVSHLRREEFRKISYPIITRTELLKKYLINNSFLFSIDTFLNTSNFQGIELDSWYH